MKPDDEPPDDESIARLLRDAGERERPAAAMQAEVRAAVEAEWRDLVAARGRRRRVTGWAVAAGVALAALGVWLIAPLLDGPPQVVASLALASGQVEQRPDEQSPWTSLAPGSFVTVGAEIRTVGDARAALALESGIALRLDRATRLAFHRGESVSLHEGAAYVDTGTASGPRADAFSLRTASGTVRHLGTQYQVRVEGERVRVAVREGRVRIDTSAGEVSGVAGEQILLDAGRVTRLDLPAHDTSWNWSGAVALAYPIEGSTLLAFLRWAARETGRELVFADPQTEEAASRIVLRGSVEGLTPDESILAVRATTGLEIEVARARIEVGPSHH